MEVYAAAFRDFHWPEHCHWLVPIGCGDYRPHPNTLHAATGKNLNALNPYLNEFSVLHWVAENRALPPLAGMVHYRKYFDLAPPAPVSWLAAYRTDPTPGELHRLTGEGVEDLIADRLGRHDIICPKAIYMNQSIRQQYEAAHDPATWLAFEQAIREREPSYARHLKFFEESNRFVFFGMFITHRDIFLQYVRTVVPILLRLMEICPVVERHDEDKRFRHHRYPAFLGERFFMLWLHVNRFRIHECTVAHLEDAS
jgi:hypothetical protein